MNPLTIYIADDQNISREGIKSILQSLDSLRISGEAFDGEQLLDLVRSKPPDAVLLDLQMPGINGIETAQVLQQEHPQVGIVVLSNFDDDLWVEAVMDAGIPGYVLKGVPKEEILAALIAVYNGGEYYSVSIREKMTRIRKARKMAAEAAAEFTARELEVINLISNGFTSPMIAEALSISPRTVNVYRGNIYRKAGVPNAAALASYAKDRGLIRGQVSGGAEV